MLEITITDPSPTKYEMTPRAVESEKLDELTKGPLAFSTAISQKRTRYVNSRATGICPNIWLVGCHWWIERRIQVQPEAEYCPVIRCPVVNYCQGPYSVRWTSH